MRIPTAPERFVKNPPTRRTCPIPVVAGGRRARHCGLSGSHSCKAPCLAARRADRLPRHRCTLKCANALEDLADGDIGVRRVGWHVEWSESFFDFTYWRDCSTFTPDEVGGLDRVLSALNAACDTTTSHMNDDEYIATGRPTRVQQVARPVYDAMVRRGRWFSNDVKRTSRRTKTTRERGGPPPSIDVADALLDERRELTAEQSRLHRE